MLWRKSETSDSIDVLAYVSAVDRNMCKINNTTIYLVLQNAWNYVFPLCLHGMQRDISAS
jgi:hypothetical protein